MITPADHATKALVKLALDATALKHQAIANNLANIHSTDYTPLRVNFEEQLQGVRARVADGQPLTADSLQSIQPRLEVDDKLPSGSAAAMIDSEMMKLAQNTIHYQALLKALEKRGALMGLAVNEGRK